MFHGRVHQGSILGPLLFLVYVNDMKTAVKCNLSLYADDSALLAHGKDVLEIERILSVKLDALCEWYVKPDFHVLQLQRWIGRPDIYPITQKYYKYQCKILLCVSACA